MWHDLLAVWHPGLLTLVPPFTRAHGMDLRDHVGVTALWLAWLVDGTAALPPLHARRLDQAQDLPLAFFVRRARRRQPGRATRWRRWSGPSRLGRGSGSTASTSASGPAGPVRTLAAGAEWSPVDWAGQFDVVTAAAVWRGPEDGNAWLRLWQADGPVHARVEHERGRVRLVHASDTAPLHLLVGGPAPQAATATRLAHGGRQWRLEGVERLVEAGVEQGTAAWRVVPAADGIVLHTED